MSLKKFLHTYRFHLSAAILVIGFIELAGCISDLVRTDNNAFFQYNYDAHVKRLSDQDIEDFISGNKHIIHDDELGWTNTKDYTKEKIDGSHEDRPSWSTTHGEDGRRLTPYDSLSVRISSYGDSTVYCDEVPNHETWQFYLSRLTHTRVLNYGTSGSAPDQALLKLERHLKLGKRFETVILGMPSENIKRIMGRYRVFYQKDTGVKLGFKPMFFLKNGAYQVIPNPLQNFDGSRSQLDQAYQESKKHDYWYQHNTSRPAFEFPYSVSIVKGVIYKVVEKLTGKKKNQSLYENKEAVGRLVYIFQRFENLGKQYGFQPIALISPSSTDLKRHHKGEPFVDNKVVDILRDRLKGTLVVDVLEERFEAEKFSISPYAGHPSKYGNEISAKAIYRAMNKKW